MVRQRGGSFGLEREMLERGGDMSDRSRMLLRGENTLPVNTVTVIFVIFVLITSSMELYLGSPTGFSPIKIAAALLFGILIEYITRTNRGQLGQMGQTSGLAWTLVVVYFVTYFTITIVATSCAKFNKKQLRDLKDYGLISPFVLSTKQIDELRKDTGKHNDKDDKDDDDSYFDDF